MNRHDYEFFVAQEDTDLYNVFAADDFDDDGFLDGHANEDGYHFSDFDWVAGFDDFWSACDWVDEHKRLWTTR